LKCVFKGFAVISTISVYYIRGVIFDVEQGKPVPDALFEKSGKLSKLRITRLNSCLANLIRIIFSVTLAR
jgi:hypothetical protein